MNDIEPCQHVPIFDYTTIEVSGMTVAHCEKCGKQLRIEGEKIAPDVIAEIVRGYKKKFSMLYGI